MGETATIILAGANISELAPLSSLSSALARALLMGWRDRLRAAGAHRLPREGHLLVWQLHGGWYPEPGALFTAARVLRSLLLSLQSPPAGYGLILRQGASETGAPTLTLAVFP